MNPSILHMMREKVHIYSVESKLGVNLAIFNNIHILSKELLQMYTLKILFKEKFLLFLDCINFDKFYNWAEDLLTFLSPLWPSCISVLLSSLLSTVASHLPLSTHCIHLLDHFLLGLIPSPLLFTPSSGSEESQRSLGLFLTSFT